MKIKGPDETRIMPISPSNPTAVDPAPTREAPSLPAAEVERLDAMPIEHVALAFESSEDEVLKGRRLLRQKAARRKAIHAYLVGRLKKELGDKLIVLGDLAYRATRDGRGLERFAVAPPSSSTPSRAEDS